MKDVVTEGEMQMPVKGPKAGSPRALHGMRGRWLHYVYAPHCACGSRNAAGRVYLTIPMGSLLLEVINPLVTPGTSQACTGG